MFVPRICVVAAMSAAIALGSIACWRPVEAPAAPALATSAPAPAPATAPAAAWLPPPPQTKPATIKPTSRGPIVEVTSLTELRALKPLHVSDDGWETRFAWAQSGVEDAPWVLLYAHYLYVGSESTPPALPQWGFGERPLGRTGWSMRYAPPGKEKPKQLVSTETVGLQDQVGSSDVELIFCAVAPIPLAGSYTITVGGSEGERKASTVSTVITVEQDAPVSWMAMFSRRRDEAVELTETERGLYAPLPWMLEEQVPAAPAGDIEPVFARAREEVVDESLALSSLPGQCSRRAGWLEYAGWGGEHISRDPDGLIDLMLAQSGIGLTITCVGFVPEEETIDFLARWRVNGKLVTAELGEAQMAAKEAAMEISRAMRVYDSLASLELQADCALPAWLARDLNPGDRITLEVLYWPGGWDSLLRPSAEGVARLKLLGQSWSSACHPVMSKPIKFKATREMIAAALTPLADDPGNSSH